MMDAVGRIATGLAVVALVGGLLIGVRSIPDVRRYLKIRNM
jgi:hypothetical protein